MKFLPRLWIFILLLPVTTLLRQQASAAQTPKEIPYITTANTELRKGPGAKYKVIQMIPQDVKINVVGKEGSWLTVQSKYGRETGYVDGQYARPIATPTTPTTSSAAGAFVTTGEVNLREGPGTKYKVLRKIPKGTKINVTRIDGDWLRVESKTGNPSGYIDKRFAKRLP
jgi:uncharacterized protein YraI